jgi:hypothetical protein
MKKLSDIVEMSDFFFEIGGYDKELLRWSKMEDGDVKEALLLCDKTLSEINKDLIELQEKKKKFLLTTHHSLLTPQICRPKILTANFKKTSSDSTKIRIF